MGADVQPTCTAHFADFTRVAKIVGCTSAQRSKKEQNKILWGSVDLLIVPLFPQPEELVETIPRPPPSRTVFFWRGLSHAPPHTRPTDPWARYPTLQMRPPQLAGAPAPTFEGPSPPGVVSSLMGTSTSDPPGNGASEGTLRSDSENFLSFERSDRDTPQPSPSTGASVPALSRAPCWPRPPRSRTPSWTSQTSRTGSHDAEGPV